MFKIGKNAQYINGVIIVNFIDKAYKKFYKESRKKGNPNTRDVIKKEK